MPITGVLETCLYVDDLERAERFYADVLGLRFFSRHPGRHVFFHCGGAMLLLFHAAESSKPGEELPPHGSHGPGHVAFAVAEAELVDWQERLTSHGIAIELDFHWPQGGRSLYFRDPAGNSLELATPRIWGLPESTCDESRPSAQ